MHVVYLIDSLIAGGAERSLAALAPRYIAAGVELDVAYFYERDNVWLPALRDAGARTTSLAGRGGRAGLLWRTRRLIRERRPDVLHTTLFDADVIGRVAAVGTKTTVVTSLVNAAYGAEQRANPAIKTARLRAAQLLDRVTAVRVNRFHAVSESVADVMSERLHVARERIDVIPRGRDIDELGTRTETRRVETRRALDVDDDETLFLAIGRHEYQKGFDVLVQAFAAMRDELPRSRLLIVGREGSETPRLTQSIAGAGLEDAISLTGFRSDVPDLLCAADVFVSASRWEGAPGGVLEAMALETPIVATDIAPVREVLGEQRPAFLVAPEDAQGLARSMVEAVSGDGAEARTRTARARFLDRFTIDRTAAEMLSFYERASR